MNFLRDKKKFIDDSEGNVMELQSGASINHDHLEAAELESKIWEVIQSLPDKCKEVFILNRFEDKKYAEIAEKLNISVKTVEGQMSKALRVLREHLSDYIHLLLFLLIKNLW